MLEYRMISRPSVGVNAQKKRLLPDERRIASIRQGSRSRHVDQKARNPPRPRPIEPSLGDRTIMMTIEVSRAERTEGGPRGAGG